MSWRYQPVWIVEDDEKVFGLIEVHFDEHGTVSAWTTEFSGPCGNSKEELCNDVTHLLMDAHCWVPVALTDMKVGIELIPLVSMTERKDLADFIDAAAGDLDKFATGPKQ